MSCRVGRCRKGDYREMQRLASIDCGIRSRGVTELNRAELSKARVRLVIFWKGSDLARVPLFSKIQARARVRLELIKIELGSGSFV